MKKPFIKLFRTPNANYIFEVNKNEFLKISDESYNYLHNIMSGDTPHEMLSSMPQELEELKADGYLADDSVVQTVRHPYTDYVEIFLERKLSLMTLQLTQDCNLRCTYCIYAESETSRQRSHARNRMSWEIAKKAVDFFWNHSVDSPRVNIGFYGGEPLLEFPLLQRVVEYCKKRFLGKELTFSVTTNGTLLSDDIIHYLDKQKISVMLSLDGPKEVHDLNRVFEDGKGTFDVIATNIQRIKKIAPELAERLQAGMVLNPENDFDCVNSICVEGAELDKLTVSASIVEFDYEDKEVPYSEDYAIKMEYHLFLAILSRFQRVSDVNISPISSSFMTSLWEKHIKFESIPGLNVIDAPSGPCVPGQLRLFVNVFGQFFPCERVSEQSPIMCIGNLDAGFYSHIVNQQLNIGKLTEDVCINCWCFRHCELCVKKADVNSEILSAVRKLSFCKEVEGSVYDIFRHHILFHELPLYYQKEVRIR